MASDLAIPSEVAAMQLITLLRSRSDDRLGKGFDAPRHPVTEPHEMRHRRMRSAMLLQKLSDDTFDFGTVVYGP
jgi:hypothetical protein